MIEYTHTASKDDNYTTYNHFLIDDRLGDILYDDYYTYNTKESNKVNIADTLYTQNFYDKYDPIEQKQIFDLYINNDSFKNKAKFIYSIIDVDRYKNFVAQNETIQNPQELKIVYSIIDSTGVKVTMYDISIADIAFVF